MRKSHRSTGKATRSSVKDRQALLPKQPRRRGASWLVLSTAMALLVPQAVRAVELSWDPDTLSGNNNATTQIGLGGPGVWDTSSSQWWTGVANQPWVNANRDTAVFGGLTGGAVTLGNSIVAGGLTFNTGGYVIGPDINNTFSLTLSTLSGPLILRANADGTIGADASTSFLVGSQDFVKQGGGTLSFRGNNQSSYTGDAIVEQGTLALVGDNNTIGAGQDNKIYLRGGNLSLQYENLSVNGVATFFNDVIVERNATINVDRSSAVAQIDTTIEMGSLTLGAQTLTVASLATSNFGLRFLDTITLNSSISTISTALNPVAQTVGGARAVTLGARITGSGSLNKVGTGTLYVGDPLDSSGTFDPQFNDYTGGTNILQGTVAAARDTASFGTGRVVLNPGATLRLFDNFNLDGDGDLMPQASGLTIGSTASFFGNVVIDTDIIVDSVVLQAAKVGTYGTAFQFAVANIGWELDMSKIGSTAPGNGPVFLGAATLASGLPVIYSPFSGILFPAADNIYRLGGNTSATTILQIGETAFDENFLEANAMLIGSPIGAVQGIANGTGTVRIAGNNTGLGNTPITVNKLSTLNFQASGGTIHTPFGFGMINVYGTLSATGTSGAASIANQTYNVFSGGTIDINNTLRTGASGGFTSTPQYLSDTATINLNSGVLIHRSSNVNKENSAELLLNTVNLTGGNTISVQRGTSTDFALAKLLIGKLVRFDNATVGFTTTAVSGTAPNQIFSYLGVPSGADGLQDQQVIVGPDTFADGALPLDVLPNSTVTKMVAPWLVDATNNTFLTYDSNGAGLISLRRTVGAATPVNGNFTVNADTSAAFIGGDSNSIIDINAAFALTGDADALALRVNNVALTGAFKISLGSSLSNDTFGAGLLLNISADQTHTPNWEFGGTGASAKEAVIYVSGTSVATLSGTVSAKGLTKFGTGQLRLSPTAGTNTALLGTITLNQGTLRGVTGGFNKQAINIAGGTLFLADTVNGNYLNNITVKGDATIDPDANNQPRIANLTIASRNQGTVTGVTDPIVLNIIDGGLSVDGTTTLAGSLNLNHTGNAFVLLRGSVSGAGSLNKWGNGTGSVALLSGANTYTGGTVINAGALFAQSATGPATAVAPAPFGTGQITINPGGILRLSSPNNTAFRTVNVNSDMSGLAVIALAYNGNAALPTAQVFNYNYTNLGAPFSTVLAIDAVGFSGTINQSTFAGGKSSLGSTLGGVFTGIINPNASNEYRLGGGGNTLSLNGANNQLGGETGPTASVQIGLLNNNLQANSVIMTNGTGTVQIVNTNNYSGDTIVNGNLQAISNTQATLSIGNSNAIGTGRLIFNGGGVQAQGSTGLSTLSTPVHIINPVSFLGDAVFNGGTDLFIDSTVSLGNAATTDNQVGVTRNFTVNNTTGRTIIAGNIVDGVGGSGNGLTKSGTGTLVLKGTGNAYTGNTFLTAGALVVGTDTSVPLASQISFNGGSLGIWDTSFTTNRSYVFQGNGTIDVGASRELTQSATGQFSGPGMITKAGQGTLTLNGHNANSNATAYTISNGVLAINRDANLGDPNAKGQIILSGGALRVNGTFESGRNITTGSNLNGALDVTAGQTFSLSGGLNAVGTGIVTKTGEGTLYSTANNAIANLVIANGTFKSSSNLPFQVGSSQSAIYNTSSFNVTGLVSTANLAVGMPVFGPGMPAGVTIAAITGQDSIRLSATPTASSNNGVNPQVGIMFGTGTFNLSGRTNDSTNIRVLTGFTGTQTDPIFIGQLVSGPNIPIGSVVVDKTASSVTISNDATAPVAAGSTVQFSFLGRVSDTLAGGTLLLSQTNTDILVSGRYNLDFNYSGGGHLKMENGPTNSVEFQVFNIDRVGLGTMVIEPTTKTLGSSGTDGARLMITNAYLGNTNLASLNTNGILAPSVVVADQTGAANFVTYTGASNGIATYSGPTISTLSGLQPTAIANITATQNITGTASAYAVRTNSNIFGGTLRIPSASNLNQGGLLLNDNLEIGSNVVIDISGAATLAAETGELLTYVAPGKTAEISGALTTRHLTKFGTGTLVLSGAGSRALGTIVVQDGALQVTAEADHTTSFSDLILNNQGMLDLNGSTVGFSSLSNSAGQVGGIVGNSSTTSDGKLIINSLQGITSTYAGEIVDALPGSGGNRKTALVKAGNGTLTLGGFNVANPDAGNNTFTGGTTIYRGTLSVQNPYALGGANGTTAGAVSLFGGTLDLKSNGAGVNGSIDLGNKLTVNILGPSVINVDRIGANSGNAWVIGDLNLSRNTLTMTGANSYRLRVDGTTDILGGFGTIATNSDGPSGVIELAGQITGSGSLNKITGGNQRTLIISGTNNTYTGGTNVLGGYVQVTGTTGTPLGTGRVSVFPGGGLRIAGNGSLGGAPLQVASKFNALGAVILDSSFDPSAAIFSASTFGSAYHTSLQLGTLFFNEGLDMTSFGDGRAFLGSGITATETAYIASSLVPGVADPSVPGVPVYRLSGGQGTLAIAGPDNVLIGTAFLQVGSNLANVGGVTFGQGTVSIRSSNTYSGGTQIAKGTTLNVDIGTSPAGSSPLGSGTVEIFGTLATGTPGGYNGVASFVKASTGLNANTYLLRPGGTILIRDVAGSVPGGQGRWADSAGLDLNGGTFRLDGFANYASSETVGAMTTTKGSTIFVNRANNAGTATLILASLGRGGASSQGTLAITTQAVGNLGLPSNLGLGTTVNPDNFDRLVVTSPTGLSTSGAVAVAVGAPAATLAPTWIVDATAHSYVTYIGTGAGATGFQTLGYVSGAQPTGQVSYSVNLNANGTTNLLVPTGNTAGTATMNLANNSTSANGVLTLGENTNVFALRLSGGDTALTTASRTFTIASTTTFPTLKISGEGLLFNNIVPGADNFTSTILVQPDLVFGTSGTGEARIYASHGNNSAGGTNRISLNQINGQITATNLTKFGGGQVNITASNPNLLGTIALNTGALFLQNTLGGTNVNAVGVTNSRPIVLNSGTLILDGLVGTATTSVLASGSRVTTNFKSDITVAGDATLSSNSAGTMQLFRNLTLVNLGARTPIVFTMNSGFTVTGTTSLLGANNIFNVGFNSPSNVLAGQVTGGTLTKFGNAALLMGFGNNTYAGTVINASDVNTATSIVGSLIRVGAPFGTGPITVNPGGMLRIASASNIGNNAVTLNSDGQGLAGLALAYNGAVPTIQTSGTATAGAIVANTTSDFRGTLALDVSNFSTPLKMGAGVDGVADGLMWLGTSLNPSQNGATNFNSGGVNYFASTLGVGAGNTYRLGGGGNQGTLVFGAGAFENVLTGTASVQIGALTGSNNVGSPAYINGNIGSIYLTNRNDFTGGVTLNAQAGLQLSNAFALGSGALRVNGGNLILNSNISLPNNIVFVGDTLNTNSNTGSDASLNGNVDLSNGGSGVNATLAFNANGVIGFQGVISSGTGLASGNVAKTGTQAVVFNGLNTYTGTTSTNTTNGFLYAGTSVLPNQAGAFGISDSPIVMISGNLGLAGQIEIARDISVTNTGTIRGQTLANSVISGGINVASGQTLTIDQQATGLTNFVGGTLDLQGPLSGTGAIQLGTTTTSTGTQPFGTIRLSANSNGLGTSTFSGTVTYQGARLQIASDTFFQGTAASPTIISGPLGTGNLAIGAGGNSGGVMFEADGKDRTIVNALSSLGSAGNTILGFGGHYGLTFSRNLDLNSDGTLRNRVFNVLTTQKPITFAGVLSSSSGQGMNLLKQGNGTLVLSGINTHLNKVSSDTNYGTTAFIDAGVLSVSQNANLGIDIIPTTVLNTDVRLRGGTLQVTGSFSTARDFILTSTTATVTGIDVTSGNTLTLTSPMTGTLPLVKSGNGTLALNAANTFSGAFTIGGATLASAAGLGGGTGGGVVSTTLVGSGVTPFGTGALTLNGGTISIIGSTGTQAINTGAFTYSGGSYIQLAKNGSTTTTLTAASLARGGNGTLTLLPSALANLGVTEKVVVSPGAGPAISNNMLTVPSVYVRLAGVGQDATFANYGANGFVAYNSPGTTTTSLASSNPTFLADLSVATNVGANPVNIWAVRTSANITGTNTLQINGGGLILNGAAGVTVSAPVIFGTSATALVDGLVYVRDGQSAASSIAGDFSANNFVKSGPGTLLIGGTNNVMATTTTGLRNLTINEGVVRFSGQSSVPNGGAINIVANDTGTFDLAGLNLRVGGLTGTGRVTSTTAATLEVDARNNTAPSAFNGVLSGANLALRKSGNGTLILGDSSTYGGGTTINAGPIFSSEGLYLTSLAPAALGSALQANASDALGTGPITLAGGTLNINVTSAASESIDNIAAIQFGTGEGYDITIAATNGFGSANTTSAITTTNATAFQAINSLTVNAPVLTLGTTATGTNDNGLLVKGLTTLAGNTTLVTTRNAVLAGKISASGSTITKIGTNTLFLTNFDSGAGANDVGGWKVSQGTMEVRLSQGGSNPFTNGSTIQLNGGVLNLRHDGDNLGDPQVLTTFITNDIQVGSMTSLASLGYESSQNSVLDVRTLSAGNHKTLLFDQLKFGGTLGTALLTQQGNANVNYNTEFVNGLTMVNNAMMQLNNNGSALLNLTISGTITGNGTLLKQGGGELDINTTSATSTGGTVLAGGSTYFAAYRGNTRILSDTAKLPGNISIQPGASLRFTGLGNVNAGNWVDLRSNLSGFGVIGIGQDAPLSAYNLRTPGSGGVRSSDPLTASGSGGGVIALNTVYSQALNLATIGNGTLFLGSTNNGSGTGNNNSQNGVYTASTLGVGRDNTYRLGAGSGVLYFGENASGPANVVTGTANLVVGAPVTNSFGGTPSFGAGLVVFNTAQDYTGATTVNRNSTLEFRGALATSSFEVFGTVTAGGLAGKFLDSQSVTLRSGANLNLDNSFDLLPVGDAGGRWADTKDLTLNGVTMRVIGNAAADLTETIGTVTVEGGAYLTPQRVLTSRVMEIRAQSLLRATNVGGIAGNSGVVSIEGTNTTTLGGDERVTLVSGSPGVNNGMVAPWMMNTRDSQFLTYGEFGFANAGFDRLLASAGTLGAAANGSTNDRLLINGATLTFGTLAGGVALSSYALRTDVSLAKATQTDADARVIIASGGLLTGNVTISITPQLVFGSTSTPVEGIIANNGGTLTIGDTSNSATSGQIRATNLVKAGNGTLQLDSSQASFNGPIAVNRGNLTLRTSTTTADLTSNEGGNGSNIIMNSVGSTLALRSDVHHVFNSSLTLGRDNPLVVVSADRFQGTTANTQTISLAGNLAFLGSAGEQGQTLTVNGINSYNFKINGTTNLGPAGRAVFNTANAGTNPTVTLTGAVSGAATLVKTGTGTLNLGVTSANATFSNTFTGGILLVSGTLSGTAGASSFASAVNVLDRNPFGTNNTITIQGGQLNVRVDQPTGATYLVAAFDTNDIVVNGSGTSINANNSSQMATISVDRVSSSNGTNKAISFKSLTIGNHFLQSTSGNGVNLLFDSTNLLGAPTFFTNGADLTLNNITDGGAGYGITKYGSSTLWINGTNNTYSGPTIINQGFLRFGTFGAPTGAAQLANTSSIVINPGAAIRVNNLANLAPGQKVLLNSTSTSIAMITAMTGFDPSGIIAAGSSGVLALEANNATALNLGTLGNGTFYLGAFSTTTTPNSSYTANTLGVGANDTYRLGGGGTGVQLILAPAVTTSNVLTGTAKVVIGSLAANGTGTGTLGTGQVTLNTTNNYSGGTVVARGSILNFSSGGANTPLGSGQVDLFGQLTASGAAGTFLNSGGGANNNAIVLHPGANLRLDNSGTNVVDRWHNTTTVALDGATFNYVGNGTTASTETIGQVTFQRGARITLQAPGSAILTVTQNVTSDPLTRIGNATLVFANSGSGRLGSTLSGGEQFKASATYTDDLNVNRTLVTAVGSILPGYFVAGNDNRFVTYASATGFGLYTANGSNVGTDFNASTGLGANFIGDLSTGTSTLRGDATVYALRLAGSIANATGTFNTITFQETAGGLMGGIIAHTTPLTIAAHLKFGSTGQGEALLYSALNITTTLTGDITAGKITKFGLGALQINKDQNDAARGVSNGYSNGWVVNEGQLNINTFGGLGNSVVGNSVTLNGSQSGAAILRLQANNANSVNATYTSGKITAVDNAIIQWEPGGDDRTHTIADLEIQSTGGSALPAQLRVDISSSTTNTARRSILQAGTLTVTGANANGIITVNANGPSDFLPSNSLLNGMSTGLSVASLIGGADDTLTKWGSGMLYVRGASTFAGIVSIEQGGIQILHRDALGDEENADTQVRVKRLGVLDINVAGYEGEPTYEAGSAERWSADGARGRAGGINIDIGAGTLQIGNDQTATAGNGAQITMQGGGGIEGYLRSDDNIYRSNPNQGVVYRTVSSAYSFVLNGDSFVGQNLVDSVDGANAGARANEGSPFSGAAAGTLLEIKGNISGSGALTKRSLDTVVLSGSNTYGGGTFVSEGTLRMGANNVMPSTGELNTKGSSIFDLNGFNQTVGKLSSTTTVAQQLNNHSGFISNSSTTIATLTVGNGVSTTNDYDGVIQNNVGLTKTGTGGLNLTNAHTYAGPTNVNQGVLRVASGASITGTSAINVANGAKFVVNGNVTGGLTTVAGELSGSGTITADVTIQNGGSLSAGDGGIGTLSINNHTLALEDGSSAYFQLGATLGTSDQVKLLGSNSQVTFDGNWSLHISGNGDFDPTGKSFVLFDGSALAPSIGGDLGNYAIIDDGGFAAGLPWNFEGATLVFDAINNDVILMNVIPEPGTWNMLAASLGMALGLQRFRRRRATK